MKKITTLTLLFMAFITVEGLAQGDKPLSPKETLDGTIDGSKVQIVYCKPSARNRKMLGGIEPYGQVWRTGANDATTISFDKPVVVEGKELPAGKYEFFTIPGETEWVLIFQKYGKQWGAYSYKKENDVLRVSVKPEKTDFTETFTISIQKDGLNLKWETTSVSAKIKKG